MSGEKTEKPTQKRKKKAIQDGQIARTPDLGASWTKVGPINDGRTIAAIQPSILTHPGGKLQGTNLARRTGPQQAGVTQGRHQRVGELPPALGLRSHLSRQRRHRRGDHLDLVVLLACRALQSSLSHRNLGAS